MMQACSLIDQRNADQAIFSRNYDYRQANNNQRSSLSLSLRPVDADLDIDLIHRWMNFPHVEEFWQQAWPLQRISDYLVKQIDSYHQVMIVCVNNAPIAYTELYPVIADPLSECGNFHPDDWGWHLLIGPPDFVGCGLSKAIGHLIVSYLFERTDAGEVFCEPDHRNTRMIKFVKHLGHEDRGLIQLGKKQARLMACRKSTFVQLMSPQLIFKPPMQSELPLLKELAS